MRRPRWAPQGARDPFALAEGMHRSHIQVPVGTRFPITRKVTIGVDKSMLIELPIDLQNVLVSNPEVLDAVVQSSRQVYLLAKDVGDANAFFIGPDGQKLVFLEVTVARDLTALTDALNRLLPGARIKVGGGRRQRRADRQRHQSHRCQPRRRHRRPLHQEEGQPSSTCWPSAAKEQVLLQACR